MIEIFNYLIGLFKVFSPAMQVFLVILLGGLLFFGYNFVKNEAFRKSIITMFFRSFYALNNKTALLNHELFFKEKVLGKMIESIHYPSENKTELFRTLLKIKVNTAISITRQFVKTFDSKLTNNALFENLFNNMCDIIETYEEQILTEFKSTYGKDKGAKLFYIIYEQDTEKIKGFKIMHEENVRFITKTIEKVSHSKAFSTKQKCYLYLNQIEMALELSITDCESTFAQLNGDIDKTINN